MTHMFLRNLSIQVYKCIFKHSYSLIVGEGNGTPLQYSCLGNPVDGGAWRAIVHGTTKSQMQLSD